MDDIFALSNGFQVKRATITRLLIQETLRVRLNPRWALPLAILAALLTCASSVSFFLGRLRLSQSHG